MELISAFLKQHT